MSKTVHCINIPMITNNDFTPLFDALEDIGFTIDTSNNRAYWKTSGICLGINSGYVRIGNTSNPDIDTISSYRIIYDSSKLYYIKFNEKSIAIGFVSPSMSSSTGLFSAYIVEPDVGETNWAAISPYYYFYTSGSSTNLPPYLSNTRAANMPDSFLIVPAKLKRSGNPFNLKNIYLSIDIIVIILSLVI